MTQPNMYVLEGGASNEVQRIIGQIFLEIRHQFHTSILLWNWILTNQQTSTWNLGKDEYFEYTSWYFKVVILFVRNLFRVILKVYSSIFITYSYVLLIKSLTTTHSRNTTIIIKEYSLLIRNANPMIHDDTRHQTLSECLCVHRRDT
jgi:hypothetical protein